VKPLPELGRYVEEPKPEYGLLVREADSDGDERVTGTEFEKFVLSLVAKEVEARFQRLDRNRDGLITRSEVPTMDPARFLRFDRNRDARLTPSELERVLGRQAESRCHAVFARMDLDRDGVLSAAE